MTTIRIRPEELPHLMRKHRERVPAAIAKGIRLSAERTRSHLVQISPVDLGQFKNAWQVSGRGSLVEVSNSAPHAGIIERGARPHKVSREGFEAIKGWVKRKILRGAVAGARRVGNAGTWEGRTARAKAHDWVDEEATRITWAIVKKIEKEGQKGLWLVNNSMPKIKRWLEQEIKKAIIAELKKP